MKMQRKKLPNFLVVGAAKSGTTSLYHYLKQHPDVFMPDWKEPAFFTDPTMTGAANQAEYEKMFAGAHDAKAAGEASVSYLCSAGAPHKIAKFLGEDTKIIALLRNPVDMAYSLWGHQRREGFEDLVFEDALEREQERMEHPEFAKKRQSWILDFAYKARASYAAQIENYAAVLPNIQVFIFEEFFAPSLPQFVQLCDFLGIDNSFRPEENKHNPAGTVKSALLRDALQRPSRIKDTVKTILPLGLRQKIRKKIESFNRVDRPLPPLSPETRRKLEMYFAPDVRKLEEILGRSLKEIWF